MEIMIFGCKFETEQCLTCGVVYTVPVAMMQQQRRYGEYHYCPSGHQQGWAKGDPEFETVRFERDRLKQQLAQKDDEIRSEQAKHATAVREIARIKKRANAGLCPCCNRTFQDVVRHMKQKHPEVAVLAPREGKTA